MASASRQKARTTDKPLQGQRILVSRVREQAGEFSNELRSLGAEVLQIPFIEIRNPSSFKPLDGALQRIASYDWLILTSVNGVKALLERLQKLGLDRQTLRHLQIAAIGPATRKAIEKRGLHVSVVPEEYVAESVVRSLRSRVQNKRLLLVRAKVARDVIPRELRNAGAHVDVVDAYETVVPKTSQKLLRSILADVQHAPDIITFTSSSTARNFVQLLGASSQMPGRHKSKLPEKTKLASIGPVTSATLRELGLQVDIQAREYTIPGLVKAIVATMGSTSSPRRNSAI
jgi:uroporphyrinogen-III synthase